MRRLMRFAVKLYPAAWRARYGQEFEALLEDTGPVGRDMWNVMGGALKMQMVTWSSWKLVPALGVAGAIAMGVASLMIQTEYVSSGVMRVTPMKIPEGETPGRATAQHVDAMRSKVLSRASLLTIIAGENLYPRERAKTTLEDTVDQMRRDVQFWPVSEHGGYSAAFELSFRYPDPYKAQRVTRQLISQMVDANILVMMEAKGEHSAQVEVLDPASLPRQAILPNRPVMIVVGLTAGLLLGLAAAGVRRWCRAR
jgi:capsular polysaccharide biosynthesis protein